MCAVTTADGQRFLTAVKAAGILGLSPHLVHKLVALGLLKPVIRPGYKVRFDRADVEAIAATYASDPPPPDGLNMTAPPAAI